MSSSRAALTFSFTDCERGVSAGTAVGGAFRTGVGVGVGRDAEEKESEGDDKHAPARVEEGVKVEGWLDADVDVMGRVVVLIAGGLGDIATGARVPKGKPGLERTDMGGRYERGD